MFSPENTQPGKAVLHPEVDQKFTKVEIAVESLAPFMTTILQIEDNLANRILTERVLAPHGYHIIQADTGESGIEMAIENRPDLILIDIGLPDYDGHTVLSLLQQIPDLALTPFVAITAWPADKAIEICERYGYDGWITKPIDVKTFPALIHKFLQLKKNDTSDQDFRE